MTTPPSEQGAASLAPCPFCGHSAAPKVIDSEEFADIVDGEFDASNSVSYAVVCDASNPGGPGGCGAMGGFAPTEAAAVDLWNRRASLPSSEGAVAWQVRRTDGSPLACWEACTRDLYDATLASGRYSGYEDGPPCEVRALVVAGAAPVVEPGAQAGRVAEDAARWRHTKRSIRMDNFGGYVVHPDDPADFNGIVAERFEREVDAARATQGDRNGTP